MLPISPTAAFAQSRTATLTGWQERLHTALMDRRHAEGGYFFDRGVFRHLMPVMDHEYLLDEMTFRFMPSEEAAWMQQYRGYRSYMGSIDKSHFSTRHALRHRVTFDNGLAFLVNGRFQEDLRAHRFLVAPGLEYSWSRRHTIGFQQTFGRYKPDLDLRLFYELHDPQWGQFRLGLTALDLANNLIFDDLGVDPTLQDRVRIYKRRPWLLSARLQPATYRGLRLEVVGGMQLLSRARVHFQHPPNRQFNWEEKASYVGVMGSYRLPFPTDAIAGLQYQHTFSKMQRSSPSRSVYTSAYRSRQSYDAVSMFARIHWWQLRFWGGLTRGAYTDRQRGTDFDQSTVPEAFTYREHFWKGRLRMLHLPTENGLLGGLEYLALNRRYDQAGYHALREADFLTFRQTPWNNRLVLLAGYQFAPGARLMVGVGYDLDGDRFHKDRGPVRYDGGFGRLSVQW